MSGTWRTLAFALALGAGACAHTKTTDDGTEKKATDEEAAKQEDAKAKETKPRAAGDGKGSELHPGKPDAVPVATAPEALLTPGAEKKIREKLAAAGFLDDDKGSMREGIRRYQKAHDLPATGVADHQTVKGMGLDPNQIFRQGAVKD